MDREQQHRWLERQVGRVEASTPLYRRFIPDAPRAPAGNASARRLHWSTSAGEASLRPSQWRVHASWQGCADWQGCSLRDVCLASSLRRRAIAEARIALYAGWYTRSERNASE